MSNSTPILQIPSCYAAGYALARAENQYLADQYMRYTMIGDPQADRAVADIDKITPNMRGSHKIIGGVLKNHLDPPKDTPESLVQLVREASVTPEWFDNELLVTASKAFFRNVDVILGSFAVAAIVEGFSTLISKSFRIRSRVATNGIRRLKQNILQLTEQFLPGGMYPGGDAWRLSLRIRLVHAQSRKLIKESDEWDIDEYGIPISAAHLLLASATFSGRLMQFVNRLGGDYDEQEREAYVHVWRLTALTMGVPEEILFTDFASSIEAYRIGSLCEPPADEDSIIMANSIINSAPLFIGCSEPKMRKKMALQYYQISRELIGDAIADKLQFPRRRGMKLLPYQRGKRNLQKTFGQVWPSWQVRQSVKSFNQLMEVLNLGKLEHSYSLPDSVYDDASSSW